MIAKWQRDFVVQSFAQHAILLWFILAAGFVLGADDNVKLPVPEQAAQEQSLALVRDLYKEDFAAAKQPKDKAQLAKKLLKVGVTTAGDAAGKYVLLTQARRLAVEANETSTAMEAVDALAGGFTIDKLKMKAAALDTLTQGTATPARAKKIAEIAQALIDEAARRDDFDCAEELLKVALAASQKANHTGLVKEITARAENVAQLRKAYGATKAALAKLEKEPADPQANLVAGQYACFAKGDWERGLSMLALGGNAQLRTLAAKELARSPIEQKQLELADGWWDLAETYAGNEQTQIRSHAARLYELILPKLTGLPKDRATKRIASLPKPASHEKRPVVVGQMQVLTGRVGNSFKLTSSTSDGTITSDGSELLIIDEKSSRLVDIETGRERARFDGHEGVVYDARLSGDNKRVVSVGADDTLRVFNASSGEELRKHQVITDGDCNALVVSRDGKKAVFATDARIVRAWDLESGKELQRFSIGDGQHWVRAIAPNGLRVLAGGFHNTVQIWDVASAKQAWSFDGHNHTYGAAFTPDGTMVLVGGPEIVRIWSLRDKRELRNLPVSKGNVDCVALSRDGRRVLAGYSDGSIRLWDLSDGREIHKFIGHTGSVRAVGFTPDGRRAVSSSKDGTTRVWGLPADESKGTRPEKRPK